MATIETYQPPADTVEGIRRFGIIAAIVGVVVTAVGFLLAGEHGLDRFYEAYLVAYTFWMGVVLGSMALLMVHHLSGGAWGVIIRRPLEAAVRTLPIMAVLFVPIVFGMDHLYHWTDPEVVASDQVIRDKQAYLNTGFFLGRQVFYFAVWLLIGTLLTRWSVEHDRTGDPRLVSRLSRLSGAGLVIYSLTVTFAMIDWTMSVNPHWFSTIWGPLYMVGQGLSALAFVITVLIMLARVPPFDRVVNAAHLHDLGKLLFAFLMLWAYLNFSQFLIIWSANLKEEVPHYLARSQGGWQWVSAFLVVLHFIVPYALLLSRDIKRDWRRLRLVAGWLIAVRVIEYFWHVAPEFRSDGFSVSLVDVALPVAMGGIFIALYAMQLRGQSLLPLQDAGLEKALAHHVH